MKPLIAGVATLLSLAGAGPGLAGGINLAWDQCWPEGGTSNRRFACDTNAGYQQIVGSFAPFEAHPNFVGTEIIMDVVSLTSALPDWWQFFNPGSCRRTALSASADFAQSPQTSCVDPWQGRAAGGIAAYQTSTSVPPVPNGLPNAARLKVAFALEFPESLGAEAEYYGFRLSISNAKTFGDSACGGCESNVCILLTEIKVADSGGFQERLWSWLANGAVTWECASWWWGEWATCYATPGCTVAARNATWGQVKSLYR
ncbi:MAG: hypothetical protein HZC42_05255 [Candidatus Eisenbacteria bacterium]|nr:hypothetical protein [Candidatus Eisenbacteria bacterium]